MRLLLHPMAMSCLKLPYQARVPVIRGLTRFLAMAEALWFKMVKTAKSSLTALQFFTKKAKEGKIIARKISFDAGFQVQKNGL